MKGILLSERSERHTVNDQRYPLKILHQSASSQENRENLLERTVRDKVVG